jgi:hypothetical protein
MNTPVLLIGKGLPPLEKANDGVSSWDRRFLTGRRQIVRELPLLGQAGDNLASCLKKNTPTPELLEGSAPETYFRLLNGKNSVFGVATMRSEAVKSRRE